MVVLLVTTTNLLQAAPLGTAFTYQGKLTDSGTPAQGIYDLRFTVYDSAGGGNAVAGPVTTSPVGVTNGVFTVTLDLGARVFSGQAVWLEIAARTNGSGAFATFPVRQSLTAAPYALYAANAGVAAAGAVSATSLNTLGGPAPGQVLTYTGSQLAWTSLSSTGAAWSITGNSGTAPGASFLGTTDTNALELKVNSQRALRLEPTTNDAPNLIGGHLRNTIAAGVASAVIGGGGSEAYPNTIAPDSGASVVAGGIGNQATWNGATISGGAWNTAGAYSTIAGGSQNYASAPYATISGGERNTNQGNFATIPGGQNNEASGGFSFAAGRNAKARHSGTFVWADADYSDFASSGTNQFLIRASGGVGIGVNNPTAALDVAGTVKATALALGSSLVVTNLNAELLGGLRATDFWQLGGNSGLRAGEFLGTTDNSALELRVNGQRALRLEPTPNTPISSNIVNVLGGSPVNYIAPGAIGSVIAGGGAAKFDGGGPLPNTVSAEFGFIGGGCTNSIQAGAVGSVLVGGLANFIQTNAGYSVIGGGSRNSIQTNASYSVIGGGSRNSIQTNAHGSVLVGGDGNSIQEKAIYCILGGGHDNSVEPNTVYSVLVGGFHNSLGMNAPLSVLVGGENNRIEGNASHSVLGGGDGNIAYGPYVVVCGGVSNLAGAEYSTVGGGRGNTAGIGAFVGGGGWEGSKQGGNTASGIASAISGGWSNAASGIFSAIAGGTQNTASGEGAAVGGGSLNTANRMSSTVPGGEGNVAGGYCSFAAGRRAKVYGDGTFVWADSVNHDLTVTASDQFVVRASGGCNIWTGVDPSGVATGGVFIVKGGVDWHSWCDRNLKQNSKPVDDRAVLEKVAQLPVTEWNLITQDPTVRHIGPVAQDFHAAFNLGGSDDKSINNTDAHGVLFAAVKGLNQKVEEDVASLRAENAALKRELAELKDRLDALVQKP